MPRKSSRIEKITTMPDPVDDFVLRCTIDDVLAARGLKSRREAWQHVPGIGHNTIQTLADGSVQGVDFKTLIRLCVSLRCSLNDLFVIEAKEDEVKNDGTEKDALNEDS